MRTNNVAFIPARGKSKSIPLKNIKLIAGKPLIYWTIEAALETKFIDHVYVSTDSLEIKNCVKKIKNKKLSVIERSQETATDEATSESALIEFCQNYNFEYVFFIQATSPLLTSEDLCSAWEKFSKTNSDSLLSVARQKRFIWEEKNGFVIPKNYCPAKRPRRQNFDGFLVENGAFYLSSKKAILGSECRISGKIQFYEMNEKTYYEIDEPSDLKVVEKLLEIKSEQKNKLRYKENHIVSTQENTS
jgi:N-acylneuraminate cytidylyltransferase